MILREKIFQSPLRQCRHFGVLPLRYGAPVAMTRYLRIVCKSAKTTTNLEIKNNVRTSDNGYVILGLVDNFWKC